MCLYDFFGSAYGQNCIKRDWVLPINSSVSQCLLFAKERNLSSPISYNAIPTEYPLQVNQEYTQIINFVLLKSN